MSLKFWQFGWTPSISKLRFLAAGLPWILVINRQGQEVAPNYIIQFVLAKQISEAHGAKGFSPKTMSVEIECIISYIYTCERHVGTLCGQMCYTCNYGIGGIGCCVDLDLFDFSQGDICISDSVHKKARWRTSCRRVQAGLLGILVTKKHVKGCARKGQGCLAVPK